MNVNDRCLSPVSNRSGDRGGSEGLCSGPSHIYVVGHALRDASLYTKGCRVYIDFRRMQVLPPYTYCYLYRLHSCSTPHDVLLRLDCVGDILQTSVRIGQAVRRTLSTMSFAVPLPRSARFTHTIPPSLGTYTSVWSLFGWKKPTREVSMRSK
jgi:hypothetical protein